MATQIITCPSCNSRYKTAAPSGHQMQCPKCGTELTIPSESAVPSDPWDSFESSDDATASPPLGNLANQRRPRQSSGSALNARLMPFLIRLGLGLGILSAIILLGGIIGWFSEPIGLVAAGLGIGAMVGLLAAGRIWMIVIAFQRSAGLGVVILFVPLAWIYLLYKRIGRSQLAFALMVSSLLPGVLTLGIARVLQPHHSPVARRAARAAEHSNAADRLAEMIHEQESENPPSGEPRQATFGYMGKIDDPSQFLADGDRNLSQFTGYEKGSLALDQEQRTISFQHRGSDDLQARYRVYLSGKSGFPIVTRPK